MLIMFHTRKPKGNISSYRVHIVEVLNGLSRLGHKIIYSDGQYHSVSIQNNSSDESAIPDNRSFWKRTKSRILALPFKNEILLLWRLTYEGKLFFLALITILRNKPDAIYWRNDICFSGHILAKLFRLPSVVEINGIIADEVRFTKNVDKLTLIFFDKAERFSLWKSDRYIVVTPYLKDILSHSYGIPENKIIVIGNGANTELFKPAEITSVKRHLGLTLSDNYICFVGELIAWEGPENLIKAMPSIINKFPNTKALIVGDGPIYAELTKLTKHLGISDKVMFTGRVPYERVPFYINASDICIVPAIQDRNQRIGGSPLKLCEYLSCGKPVVASRLKGLEILEKFGCGYLVNPEDPENLAESIIKLLLDPALRQRMGEHGRKYVLENRSWVGVAKKVAEVCESTIIEYNNRSGG